MAFALIKGAADVSVKWTEMGDETQNSATPYSGIEVKKACSKT